MKPKPRRKQLLDSASIRFVCDCEARQGRSNLQLQQFHLTKEIGSSASPPRNDEKIAILIDTATFRIPKPETRLCQQALASYPHAFAGFPHPTHFPELFSS